MTYTSFIASLRALSVTGVTKKFNAPPNQISTAALPALYIRLPEGGTDIATFGYALNAFAAIAEVVIIVNPIMQSNNTANFDQVITLMDALHTALTDSADDIKIDRWTMRMENELIGDSVHWQLVARVEASE